MTHQEYEKLALDWFVKNFDAEAEAKGGNDSTVSDIYSPKFHGYVEVKMIDAKNSARCGQFVEDTPSANPYAALLQNGQDTAENVIGFVKFHYSQKGVKYFIVGTEDFALLTFDQFFAMADFSLAKPYKKKSGSSPCPQKYMSELIAINPDFAIVDKQLYCLTASRYGEKFVYDGVSFMISSSTTCPGRINKLSKPAEKATYHLHVKMKGE